MIVVRLCPRPGAKPGFTAFLHKFTFADGLSERELFTLLNDKIRHTFGYGSANRQSVADQCAKAVMAKDYKITRE